MTKHDNGSSRAKKLCLAPSPLHLSVEQLCRFLPTFQNKIPADSLLTTADFSVNQLYFVQSSEKKSLQKSSVNKCK